MPNWNRIKNTALGWANKFSPNRMSPGIDDFLKNRPPSIFRESLEALGRTGKNVGTDVINAMTANYRPTNIRDAWTKGIPAYIDNMKQTTFNPKAWKNNFKGTLWDTATNTIFPALSLNMALSDTPQDDMEGTVEHYTKKFFDWTDVMDPANKFIYRGGGSGPVGMIASMFFNPRFTIMPKITRKIDEWLGTSVSQQELQKRFMKRLESNASDLMKKTKGLSQDDAYAQAAQNILAYNPEYYNKLMGR